MERVRYVVIGAIYKFEVFVGRQIYYKMLLSVWNLSRAKFVNSRPMETGEDEGRNPKR